MIKYLNTVENIQENEIKVLENQLTQETNEIPIQNDTQRGQYLTNYELNESMQNDENLSIDLSKTYAEIDQKIQDLQLIVP